MDNMALKKKLLEACLLQQRKVAENAMAEMKEAYHNANDYGNPEDWFDSYKSDMLTKRDRYEQQLKKTMDEIALLERIDQERPVEKVSFGAVVITAAQKLFISIGLGKVTVDDTTFFVISPTVPIFIAMRNLKKGDTFEFRGVKTQILEVF
jgi:hypothetical protein